MSEDMPAQANVEVATRAIDAWNRCDLAAFLHEWDPEAEWRAAFPKGTEGAGSVFHGHEGIAEAWRAVRRLGGPRARRVASQDTLG